MDEDDIWRAVDHGRGQLADLLDDLDETEWSTGSLCRGWRVRDVAAHLTLAHSGVVTVATNLVRAGGSLDRMIHDAAVREARQPVAGYAPRIRAMAGSRRTAPGLTPLEPLIDVLVHGQDITLPLARELPVPREAAAAAAGRVYALGWPWHAAKRFAGLRLVATDHSWSAGEGEPVEGPIAALLLTLTGRTVGLEHLQGPGRDRLAGPAVTTSRRPLHLRRPR